MIAIAAKTWREVRILVYAYVVVLQAGVIAAIAMWPHLRTDIAALGRLIPGKFLQRMFAAMADPDQATAYNAYLAVQLFFKGTNIVTLAFAVLLGTGIVARERENQTLEYLLARPVSRDRVLAAKFAVLATATVVPIFLTSMTAWPLSWMVEEHVDPARLFQASAHAAAFALLFLALTTAASVVGRTQVHVAAAVGAFIVVQVLVFFVQVIRAGSVFRLADFDVFGPLLMGHQPFADVFVERTIWLLAGAAVLFAVAVRTFRRIEP
ncbi:MAG TPA: ABC transporter permease [Planctomycetota bacterium]|nr:ABC transporter permease [Planctomycetota bacterium]